MWNFILNATIWTLALYGLFEIIKTTMYIFSYTNLKTDGIYMIIAVKNQENKIEGFIRTILFRFLTKVSISSSVLYFPILIRIGL